jgi:hypothetical protein
MKITIEIDDKKAKAIAMYINKRKNSGSGMQPDLSQIANDAAVDAVEKAYVKIVPKDVREFIEASE